jgi:hypothetical protein
MYKKSVLWMAAIGLMVMTSTVFTSCKDDDDDSNPFAGTWTKDGSGGYVTVVITESAWTAKAGNSTYNSGTYTYEGNSAQWTVTNKGIGNANVSDIGNATISDGKLTVANFNDSDMNGIYSK